jgi:hypothetical protein
VISRNKLIFYYEELLAPKLDHPLPAVRDCLFNIFAATLYLEAVSSTRNLRTLHGVVERDPPNILKLRTHHAVVTRDQPIMDPLDYRSKVK